MLATGKFDAFETHKGLAHPVFALHAATMSLFYACDAIHLFYRRLWNIMKTGTSAVAVALSIATSGHCPNATWYGALTIAPKYCTSVL